MPRTEGRMHCIWQGLKYWKAVAFSWLSSLFQLSVPSLHQVLEKADSLLSLPMWGSWPSLPHSPSLQPSYSPVKVTKAEVPSFKLLWCLEYLDISKYFYCSWAYDSSYLDLTKFNINVFWGLSLILFNFIFYNCFMWPCLFSSAL